MGDNNWEKVWCEFVDPPDTGLAVRRVSHMIGSPDTNDWRGLTEILQAAQLYNIPDGEFGEDDTRNLVGVEFPGRIYHGQGNRGLEAKIAPTVDPEWVSKMLAEAEGGYEDEAPAPKRRKKAAKKKSRSRK